MRKKLWIVIFTGFIFVTNHFSRATQVSPEEMALAQNWLETNLSQVPGQPVHLPFSFVYDGKSSKDFIQTWQIEQHEKALANKNVQRIITCTDPATGLAVRCEVIRYHDFPTLEYILHFKNTGSADTPILENIQTLDIQLRRPTENEFLLHHHEGSSAVQTDYRPFETVLDPNKEMTFKPFGGRPTNKTLSYFNLEMPGKIIKEFEIQGLVWGKNYKEQEPSTGLIIVIGWPGQWSASFTRDAADGIRIQAGQEKTHFLLHPGEEVRAPSMVLQFWKGDYYHSQNIWRRWMVAYNMPRPGGKLIAPAYTPCSSFQFREMQDANEENQKLFIDRYIEEGLKPDYWWMDAGWYICKNTEWINTGTWEVDPKRFPNGIRAISDHAHSKGVGTILWFEPERVTEGSWLWDNHPEWLLGSRYVPDEAWWSRPWKLLNLGNPQARQWVTDHVDQLLTEQGIDVYREDFNIDPLWFWWDGDTPDRQGITEIRFLEGYLAYWDELLRRNPNRIIDTCASGGRRNDVETLRRSVPFLRSDYNLSESLGNQCLGYGMAFWIPYFGTGEGLIDAYYFWSMSGAHMTPCYDVRNKDLNYDLARRLKSQWQQVSSYYYLGDYYPLTPYSLDKTVWLAYQYDLPEKGEGFVLAFRRPHSYTFTAELPLHGLDPQATYEFTDLDKNTTEKLPGKTLLETGLRISIEPQPGTAILLYKKL